jgi:hypothetical protein
MTKLTIKENKTMLKNFFSTLAWIFQIEWQKVESHSTRYGEGY